MITRLIRALFGRYCESHGIPYTSDFCGACIRAREYRSQVIDTRPEWTRAEGEWPLEMGE